MIGEGDVSFYGGNIDTLFSYSELIKFRWTKEFQTSKQLYKINTPAKTTELFGFNFNRLHSGLKDYGNFSSEGRSINKTRIVLLKFKDHNLYSFIFSKEQDIYASKSNYKEILRQQTYIEKPVTPEIINKFKQ